MAGEEVPWPPPPREPGPWNGGPPVAPPGNTPLPPLPGAGGVVHGASPQANPWANSGAPSGSMDASGPAFGGLGGPPRTDPFPGLPGGAARVDRAPVAVLVISAIIVVALIAGAALLVLKGGRQYPSAWDGRVDAIATWVAEERDLDFEHPVAVNFLSEKAYTARSTEGGDDDSVESQQYYDDQLAQLRALGFVTGDVDLKAANDTLSDSGTLAYYDPDLEQVFVRGTEMTPALRVTLAHELTHVLQDQHFDLGRMDDLSSSRASVLRALAEGDATKVEDAYIEELSDADAKAYDAENESSSGDAQAQIDAKVPPILTTLFASPYILGPELIEFLDQQDGWDAIDEALQDPPTEEAMFDPMTYKTDAADERTVEITAPSGTEVIESDEFGPTTWYLLLASRLDPALALKATDGWGGDQYVVYRDGDQVCLDATVEGDTPADVEELSKALTLWTAMSPKGTASAKTEDGAVAFHSCDPGKDAKAVGKKVSPDVLAVPVIRTQVYLQAIEADRSPDQATCYANGIIDAFTLEQLNDPKGEYLSSDAGQQEILKLSQTCFK
ncbi:MAG: hypothetical protein JWO77_815 [Ilumatobacteraceae bacterium]|nr:hypothetical protein [Ilumatobacteraceae bacterium]